MRLRSARFGAGVSCRFSWVLCWHSFGTRIFAPLLVEEASMIPQTLIIDLSEASFGGFSLVSATAERWTGKFNKATLIQLLFSAFRLLISTCGIRRFRNCGAVSHSRVLCVWGERVFPIWISQRFRLIRRPAWLRKFSLTVGEISIIGGWCSRRALIDLFFGQNAHKPNQKGHQFLAGKSPGAKPRNFAEHPPVPSSHTGTQIVKKQGEKVGKQIEVYFWRAEGFAPVFSFEMSRFSAFLFPQ